MSDDKKCDPGCGISRRDIMRSLGLGAGLILVPIGRLAANPVADRDTGTSPDPATTDYDYTQHYWGYAVDTTKCIGCLSCMRACRAENDVPAGFARTWVERYTIDDDGRVQVDVAKDELTGFFPLESAPAEPKKQTKRLPIMHRDELDEHPEPEPEPAPVKVEVTALDEGKVSKAFFVPKICNHCQKSVCTQVCPVGAAYRTADGVALVDPKRCVGCGYCVQACPYGSRFINPITHTADKCTLCYHRITKGKLPACVQACPKGARMFGDLNDPKSELSVILKQRRYRVLKPEMGTHPKCYYIGLDREVV